MVAVNDASHRDVDVLVSVDDSSAVHNSMSESEKPKKAPKKRGRHRRLEQRGVEAAVAAKPAASTTTSAGSPLADMVTELEHRCPALCPAIIPAGLDDREDGVALLALCADAAERAALLAPAMARLEALPALVAKADRKKGLTEKERRELAKQLRAVTGASARLCEKALQSHNDDMERAADWLLSQGDHKPDGGEAPSP